MPAEHTLPSSYVDAWDREHVRLPCSPRCVDRDGVAVWTTICRALHPPPADTLRLLSSLKRVRRALGAHHHDYRGLQELLVTELSEGERQHFFGVTLPHVCRLALRLPALFPQPLPLLQRGRAGAIELSAEQCGCLLAHAFWCTLPHRAERPHGGATLPDFSFLRLHGALQPPRAAGSALSATQPHKWRCLLRYFEVLAARAAAPDGGVPHAGGAASDRAAAAREVVSPGGGGVDAALAQCVVCLVGFGEEEEEAANELRLAGARVVGVGALEAGGECTHLLCEDAERQSAPAEVAAAVAAARARHVHVVDWPWFEAARRRAAGAYTQRVGGVRFERLVLDTSEYDGVKRPAGWREAFAKMAGGAQVETLAKMFGVLSLDEKKLVVATFT